MGRAVEEGNAIPRRSAGSSIGFDAGGGYGPLGHFLEEAFELLGPNWVLHLGDSFGFDLAHPFSSHLEDASNFLEGIRIAIG